MLYGDLFGQNHLFTFSISGHFLSDREPPESY